MVGQNVIFVRENLLFIPKATEQEKNEPKQKKRNLEITFLHQQKMKVLQTLLLQPILKQFTPAHSYITGIYRNNFSINISFKPLYLPCMFALCTTTIFMLILSIIRVSCTHMTHHTQSKKRININIGVRILKFINK